jgi:hypothetical protein
VLLFRLDQLDTAEVKVLNLKNIHKAPQLEHDAQLELETCWLFLATNSENISRYMKLFECRCLYEPITTDSGSCWTDILMTPANKPR